MTDHLPVVWTPPELRSDATVPVPAEADAFTLLRKVVLSLDDLAQGFADDPVALAAAACRLDALIADFRVVSDAAKRRSASLLRERKVYRLTLDMLAQIAVNGGVKRTAWRHRDLAHDLVRAAMEKGDVNHPLDVADLILDCAGIGYWKVGECEARGFDVDDYCTRTNDDYTLTIRDNRARR